MTISTFILAIALVESGNNPRAVGKAGELSEYQITERVWRVYTSVPFTRKNASSAVHSNRVATFHASKLLLAAPIVSERHTVILCAAGWHRGEAYMKRPMSRWSKETRGYADRVWNVYQDLKRKESK